MVHSRPQSPIGHCYLWHFVPYPFLNTSYCDIVSLSIRQMPEYSQPNEDDVVRFILERIDSVPHLEALLLIWNGRPKVWSLDELAHRLYVERNTAMNLLRGLVKQNLIVKAPDLPDHYFYESRSAEIDRLVEAVHARYRLEIVAISTMIHRKESSPVRGFADAFRFTKERE